MSSYREQFFEWVNKQPVYQDMTLQTKEMTLNLVDCWLNNNQAYMHYARLNGKEFAKRCAVDFCWFIKNQTIADLQHRLEVAEKALELACSHIPCTTCPNSNGAGICYIAQDIGYYQPKENCNIDNSYYFKLKAEKEMKGE